MSPRQRAVDLSIPNAHFRSAIARSAGLIIVTAYSRGLRPGLYAVTRFAGLDPAANWRHKQAEGW
jgi:hypothetical protein